MGNRESILNRRAFTLLELLAAVAVFALLVTLLLQFFESVSRSSDASQRRIETLRYGVSALERLSFDLRDTLSSGGATIFVEKGTAGDPNDSFYFLSPVRTSGRASGARKLSLVKYGIEHPSQDQPKLGSWPDMATLSRTVKAWDWDEDLGSHLPLTWPGVDQVIQDGERRQISPSVFRWEICFQLWNGALVSSPPTDLSTVRSLVIGIAALDRKAASRLAKDELESLPSLFRKAADNERPGTVWNTELEKLPSNIRANIRIYEQTIGI